MNHKICELCGTPFSAARRFCSKSCASKSKARSVESRFWEYVVRTGDCWLWTGCKTSFGYGAIRQGGRNGETLRTHRVSWELRNGPIPPGMIVLHKCDIPACVNPDHLRLGSHADNVKDKIAKGRARFGHLPGEKHGSAKLTDALVRLARAFIADGISQISIAKSFGVSTATLNAAILGKTWKHV